MKNIPEHKWDIKTVMLENIDTLMYLLSNSECHIPITLFENLKNLVGVPELLLLWDCVVWIY